MLLIVSLSSFVFLKKLNQQTQTAYRDEISTASLARAKEALLGFAAAYPEMVNNPPADTGPGYLPCPDKPADDTNPAKIGVSTSSCAISTGSSLGRLPFRTLGVTDLRDSSGERLWYVVSDNFRYNPQTKPLNSETPGDLSVDGQNDIVAVIFAPGPPLPGQNRSADPTQPAYIDVTAYLDGENNNGGKLFTAVQSDTMNDRLVTITRQELMARVEQRILNQTALALKSYKTSNPGGRYPWLAPYADPKAFTLNLTSTATAGSTSLQLQDSATDFTDWGVAAGDVVRDLTDGSIGTVTGTPSANSLNVSSLQGGAANSFNVNDTYQIMVKGIPARLRGTATGGTSNFTLEDTTKDFAEIGIGIGDVVDDRTDGSSGVITNVSGMQFTVQNMAGGVNNRFATGDVYQIRSAYGTVTATDGTFTDDTKTFDNSNRGLQIAANDIIEDLNSNTAGTITGVTNASKLAANITATLDDTYRIPRYNGSPLNAVTEGLLPFHEVGEPFRTGFTFNWTLNPSVNITVTPPPASPSPLVYSTYVTNFAESSAVSGAITTAITDNAYCYWTQPTEADCHGIYNTPFIFGVAASGSNNFTLIDSSRNFTDWGMRVGDRVFNLSDPSAAPLLSGTATAGSTGLTLEDTSKNFIASVIPNEYFVRDQTSGSIGQVIAVTTTTITVSSLFGGVARNNFQNNDTYQVFKTSDVAAGVVSSAGAGALSTFDLNNGVKNTFDSGDIYKAEVPTQLITGTVVSAVAQTIITAPPVAASVNDVIENVSVSPNSYALITAVDSTSIPGSTIITHEPLQDGVGGTTVFNPAGGDNFQIRSGWVDHRTYEFNYRHRGTLAVGSSSGERVRNLTTIDPSQIAQNSATPVIRIRDYDISNILLADNGTFNPDGTHNTVTVALTGQPALATDSLASMQTSNIRYELREDPSELPTWFTANRWQRLVYVAVASGFAPSGGGTCTVNALPLLPVGTPLPAANCLGIRDSTDQNNSDKQRGDVQALVVTTGAPLSAQDRTQSGMNSYLEFENNTSGDHVFEKQPVSTTTFNDQIRVVAP